MTDYPSAGLFRRFEDAIGQANVWAWATYTRHRIRYEPANDWWHVTATVQPLVLDQIGDNDA